MKFNDLIILFFSLLFSLTISVSLASFSLHHFLKFFFKFYFIFKLYIIVPVRWALLQGPLPVSSCPQMLPAALALLS